MILARIARIAVPAALFSFALSLAACEDPAKDKPKATVSSAAPATQGTQAAPSGGSESLTVNAAESSVGFVGSKVTGKHEGKFEKMEGSISLAGGKAEGGKVMFAVDIDSVKTDSDKLDGHLKSPDFFDAAKFVKATFESSQIKAGGGVAGATHTVTGELNLHGVRKTITFPATITVTPDGAVGTAEFSINRKDFGIVYAGKADDLIRDDVLIKLNLHAKRNKG
jgi:polyisoprenoid-binding protein YceI